VELWWLAATPEEKTANADGIMHKIFHVDNPAKFARTSFAWANSLFAEFNIMWFDDNIQEVVGNEK